MKKKYWMIGGFIVVLGIIIAIAFLTTSKPTHQESGKTDKQEQSVQDDERSEEKEDAESSDILGETFNQDKKVNKDKTEKKDSKKKTQSETTSDSKANTSTDSTTQGTTPGETEKNDNEIHKEEEIILPFVPFE